MHESQTEVTTVDKVDKVGQVCSDQSGPSTEGNGLMTQDKTGM